MYVSQENYFFATEYSNESTSPSVDVFSVKFEPLSSELLQSVWAGPGVLIIHALSSCQFSLDSIAISTTAPHAFDQQ